MDDSLDPDNTQEQPDGSHDSDTQELLNTSLKCRHDSKSYVENVDSSKAKKLKKQLEEAAPKRPQGRPRKSSEDKSKDKMAEKKFEKEFSVVVYVKVAVPP